MTRWCSWHPWVRPRRDSGWSEFADIAHLPMIGTYNLDCQRIIDDCFRDAPAPPTYVFRSDDNPTIQSLIGSGLAYAVMPLLTVDKNGSERSRHTHPARALAPPARDRMASAAQAAAHPSRPLSRPRPKYLATSMSSGRRGEPREHCGYSDALGVRHHTAATTPPWRDS